jgi:hypothetical protein
MNVRGCGAQHRGRYAKAIKHFQRSKKLEPNSDIKAFILRAKKLLRLGLSGD